MSKLKAIELFSHLFTPLFPTLSSIRSSLLSTSQITTNISDAQETIQSTANTVTTFLQSLTIQQQHLLLLIFTSIPIYEFSEFDDFSHLHSLLLHLPIINNPSGLIPLLCLKGVYLLEKKSMQPRENHEHHESHEGTEGEGYCSKTRIDEVLHSEGIAPNQEGYDECRY